MAKTYSFKAQKESVECPAIPKAVSVYGESLRDCTEKLAAALKKDPELKDKHPEFDAPKVQEQNAGKQKIK